MTTANGRVAPATTMNTDTLKRTFVDTDLLMKIRVRLWADSSGAKNKEIADDYAAMLAAIDAAMATPAEQVKVSIRASFARLASVFCARRDIRYYLRGIIVEPRTEGGAFIVATNGHALVAIIDPDATCDAPVIIAPNAETIRRLPKIHGKGDLTTAKLQLFDFAGRNELSITDGKSARAHAQSHDTTIDAKIIDWRRPIPDFEKLEKGRMSKINVSLIADLTKVFGSTRSAPSIEPFQDPSLPGSPIACRIFDRDDILLVVMPMHGDLSADLWTRRFQGIKGAKEC